MTSPMLAAWVATAPWAWCGMAVLCGLCLRFHVRRAADSGLARAVRALSIVFNGAGLAVSVLCAVAYFAGRV